jgi:hypothetical protein
MLQRFRLDRPAGLAYFALGLVGCGRGMSSIAPSHLEPVSAERVASWVSETTPRQGVLYRFTWLYQDERASKGGRGSARIAAPDSLRFDFAGSLGIGKGSAMVVGDSAVWVVPDRSVDELVPGIALLWSLLGVARGPAEGARLTGLEERDRTAWQYAGGADTVTYVREAGSPVTLYAEVRRSGKIIGRSEVTSRADGTPVKAKLTAPEVPSKLEITFYASVPTPSFPSAIWARPAEP